VVGRFQAHSQVKQVAAVVRLLTRSGKGVTTNGILSSGNLIPRAILTASVYSRICLLLSFAFLSTGFGQNSVNRNPVNLHRQALVIDAHADTVLRMLRGANICREGRSGHLDLPRLAKGGVDAEFFAIFVHPRHRGAEGLHRARKMIGLIKDALASCPEKAGLALNASDIERLQAEGKIAVLLGLEGGHIIQGKTTILREFYGLGVRYMTLTWSNSNEFADSSDGEKRWGGLNELGRRVIKEMNRLGMIVDVSHVSDETFWDVISSTTQPVIASHSSCRALRDIPRNMSDDMLKAVAANGGVVCINFYPRFLADTGPEGSAKEREVPLDVLIDHIEHAVRVAGIDHVGLGSDFDGIPTLPKGMKDVTGMPLISQRLLERGYEPKDVQKILGANLLRVIRQVTGR